MHLRIPRASRDRRIWVLLPRRRIRKSFRVPPAAEGDSLEPRADSAHDTTARGSTSTRARAVDSRDCSRARAEQDDGSELHRQHARRARGAQSAPGRHCSTGGRTDRPVSGRAGSCDGDFSLHLIRLGLVPRRPRSVESAYELRNSSLGANPRERRPRPPLGAFGCVGERGVALASGLT